MRSEENVQVRTLSSRILATAAISVLLFLLAGCGGGGAAVNNSPSTNPTPTPEIALAPDTIDFGDLALNASVSRTTTVSDTGQASLTLAAISASGDFTQTNDCGAMISAGTTCTINITFSPTALGTRSGTVTLNDNAAGNPHRIKLTGRGISTPTSAATLTPSQISFGNQMVNTTSSSQTVNLTNTGNAVMTLSSIGITGDFSQTNNCGSTLSSGAGCTIAIAFSPTALGTRSGTLTVSDSASGSPHLVPVSGTGVGTGQLSVNPTNIAFGNVTVGNTGTQSVQLSNTGTGNLNISSASTSGPGFSISGLTLPATLTAGQKLTFNAAFAPASAGDATGSVTLTISGSSPQTAVALTGTGVTAAHSVTLAWINSTSVVMGYNVYRSGQSGGPYTMINPSLVQNAIYTDSSVSGGQTYWYVVTAVAAGNVESGYSSAVAAVIPSP